MTYLTVEDVLELYRVNIGDPALRDRAAFEAAVHRPQLSAFGADAYPTLAVKTAALMQSLAQNQAFVDGNKRIAWLAGQLFLGVNGATVVASDREALRLFGERVARGLSVLDLAAWIEERLLRVGPSRHAD